MKNVLLSVCCACLGLCAAAYEKNPIARIRPRLASDVKSSNWTIGCEVLDRELAVFDEYKDFLPPLGIKRIRLQGGWARCEKEKGVYDFSWIDEPVDFCRAHGIEVLLETSYGNPIYEGAGGWDLGAGFPKSEEGLAAWDRWVEALAKHFRGRVADWAMWNEPDLKGKKTPAEIAAFNVRTAKIIKRVIPDARIAGLSLAAGGATRTVRAPGAEWSVVSVAEPQRPCESRNDGAFRAAFRTVAPGSGRVELLVTFGE